MGKRNTVDPHISEDLKELEQEEAEEQEEKLSINSIPAEPEPPRLRTDFISTRDTDEALRIIEERNKKEEKKL